MSDETNATTRVIAVGIDLVDADRIRTVMARTDGRFAGSILGSHEDSGGTADRAAGRELAARFALKEACMKALGTGMGGGVVFKDVIVDDPLGMPVVTLTGGAAARSRELGVAAIHATASVSGGTVAAVVMLEGTGKAV